jgi:two-component system, cell cycle response regulator DivK
VSSSILIIEDNELNLELVTDLLEASQFVVHGARNAEECLELAEKFSPDLVLMDLSLPGMDGLTATKLLKTNRATSHLMVIALTACAMKEDEGIALAAGCDGYLTKPIDTRSFVASVTGFIASRNVSQPKKTHI